MFAIEWEPKFAVLHVEAEGRVTHEDYVTALIPAVERAVAEAGKINLVYCLGPEFEGFDLRAMVDDAELGLAHLGDFESIAVVTDDPVMRATVKAMSVLVPAPVRVFDLHELEEAIAWARDG